MKIEGEWKEKQWIKDMYKKKGGKEKKERGEIEKKGNKKRKDMFQKREEGIEEKKKE